MRWTAVLGCVFLLSLQPVVWAQSDADRKILALQSQLDQLRSEIATANSQPIWLQDSQLGHGFKTDLPQVPPAATFKPAPAVALKATPTSFPLNESPKYPDVNVTGFFHLDTAYFGQSANNVATLGDIQDGTGFRRARLAATGNITDRASYMMEFDFAQSQARFVDVWGQVKNTPFGNIRVGRFRQPFGMTELTSIRELPFLERPSAFALAPFRQTGIMFSNSSTDARMTWAASGFRTISDNFGNVYGDDGGYGTAERLTYLLVDGGDCHVLHVGVDHSYLDPARNQLLIASQDEVLIGQQPNLGPSGLSILPITTVPPFVNSGVFNVDHAHLYNAEAAFSVGRGLVQSEYRWFNANLPTGENATLHGGYVTARWMLTGETIPYNRSTGVFGRVKPHCPLDVANGQWGAWELAARASTIDLNPLFGLPGVSGPTRRLNSFTLGLNWYMWDNAKAQLNWIHGSLNDPTLGDSVANTAACRLQIDF